MIGPYGPMTAAVPSARCCCYAAAATNFTDAGPRGARVLVQRTPCRNRRAPPQRIRSLAGATRRLPPARFRPAVRRPRCCRPVADGGSACCRLSLSPCLTLSLPPPQEGGAARVEGISSLPRVKGGAARNRARVRCHAPCAPPRPPAPAAGAGGLRLRADVHAFLCARALASARVRGRARVRVRASVCMRACACVFSVRVREVR